MSISRVSCYYRTEVLNFKNHNKYKSHKFFEFRAINDDSNKKLFSGPVHTYPDIFESETFSFRIRLSSTRIRRIRMRIRNFLNPLSRVEIFESANNLEPCGRANQDIFESDDVAKTGLVFIDTNKAIAT